MKQKRNGEKQAQKRLEHRTGPRIILIGAASNAGNKFPPAGPAAKLFGEIYCDLCNTGWLLHFIRLILTKVETDFQFCVDQNEEFGRRPRRREFIPGRPFSTTSIGHSLHFKSANIEPSFGV